MITKNLLNPHQTIKFENAIRVDVIGLPDKQDNLSNLVQTKPSSKEKKPEELPSPPLPMENPPITSSLIKENKKSKSSPFKDLERRKKTAIAQLKAIESLKESITEEEQISNHLRQIIFKGNILVNSSSLTGINKLEAENYINHVEMHVKKHWRLPQWLASSKLRAKAIVKWDNAGIPILIQILESSGDQRFDEIVIETIKKSVPLPQPPDKFVYLIKNEGVIFGFPE